MFIDRATQEQEKDMKASKSLTFAMWQEGNDHV